MGSPVIDLLTILGLVALVAVFSYCIGHRRGYEQATLDIRRRDAQNSWREYWDTNGK